MKKSKGVCIFISAMLFVGSLSFAASAVDSSSRNDTLALTQQEYESRVNTSTAINSTQKESDSDDIKTVVETFLSVEKAASRDDTYNEDFLFADNAIKSDNIKYHHDQEKYTFKLRKTMDRNVEWDNLTYSSFGVDISGNTAIATIVENYKYYINDGFDEVSNHVRKCAIALTKENGKWKVNSIKTNDPCETEGNFVYKDFDVDSRVAQTLKNISSANPISVNDSKEDSAVSTPLSSWTYNRDLAVTYAANWYNGVNSTFGSNTEDCQNFASQCVWAGFGGQSKGSIKVSPVVYDSTYGSTNSRLWEHNNYYVTNPSDSNGYGWYWDNVDGFAYYIDKSTSTSKGPYGYLYCGNLDSADKGDVIAWDTNGRPACGTLDHAMVVTKVTGTSGARGTSNFFIAAHNHDTNSAYEALVDYASYPESDYATVRIARATY